MSQNNIPTPSREENNSRVLQHIAEWKSRLIDLSRRNRLLYFKHSRNSNLAVTRPDVETIYQRLVVRKRRLEFWIPPEEKGGLQGKTLEPPEPFRSRQPTPHQLVCEGVDRQDLERILKRLSRRSLSDYRERGVRILHAALGMLVWKEIGTNEEIRAPLLVVPIELLRESILEPFAISVPPVEEDGEGFE